MLFPLKLERSAVLRNLENENYYKKIGIRAKLGREIMKSWNFFNIFVLNHRIRQVFGISNFN